MNRILIIHPEGNINNNPNLSAIVETLNGQGYAVDIIAKRRSWIYQSPKYFYKVYFLNKMDFVSNLVLRGDYNNLLDIIFRWIGKGYSLIIGIDAEGIILASAISNSADVPLVFLSYEIFFSGEVSDIEKKKEIQACNNLRFAITQDVIRANLLSSENKIPKENIFLMPVSGKKTDLMAEGDYIRKKYKISGNIKIALFIGSLEDWSGKSFVLDDMKCWPDNWVLMLHGRYGIPEALMNEIDIINAQLKNKIIVSTEPFPDFINLYKLVASADLGLGFYFADYKTKYTGKNIEAIGLSSGKISTYLACGLPVMTNKIGLYSEIIIKKNLGYVLSPHEKPSDILRKINNDDLEEKKIDCSAYFRDEICFENFASNLLEVINRHCRKILHPPFLEKKRVQIFTLILNGPIIWLLKIRKYRII